MRHEIWYPYAWEFGKKGLVHQWDNGRIVDFVCVWALKSTVLGLPLEPFFAYLANTQYVRARLSKEQALGNGKEEICKC